MKTIEELLQKKIVILDGAMGTMIQKYHLQEEDYRGIRFKNYPQSIKGNNDILVLTQPQIIEDVHTSYLESGSDIIETNTFNAQSISQADYNMQYLVEELNFEATQIARRAVERFMKKNPQRSCFIAGSVGPMNKMLSLSSDVNNPGYRAVTFEEIALSYETQIATLIEGGIDILLIETIFDTLNAKVAIYVARRYFRKNPSSIKPIMLSGTITDSSGRTLSGQTPEAFYISLQHAQPLSIGFNCALGAKDMTTHLEALNKANCYISAYPNAGLPNALGHYEETPNMTASYIKDWAERKLINIVGGCCGTTPEHISAISQITQKYTPRKIF
ncbi:MAG: homocysteine S-methyltransferase family protein [Chitinophagaceae bacterium]